MTLSFLDSSPFGNPFLFGYQPVSNDLFLPVTLVRIGSMKIMVYLMFVIIMVYLMFICVYQTFNLSPDQCVLRCCL